MTEEHGYHEIQLTGKQLIFLFMAATAVAVVIFLCGVVVGKGARPRLETVSAQTLTDTSAEGPSPAAAGTVPVADQQPPAEVKSQLNYYDRLAAKGKADSPAPSPPAAAATPADSAEPPAPPPEEPPAMSTGGPGHGAAEPGAPTGAGASSRTASAAEPAVGVKPAAGRPVPAPNDNATPAKASAPAPTEPAGGGFAVQVAAIKGSGGAEALLKRLTAKGYQAYVVPPDPPNPAGMYRVRVGKFADRATAERTTQRLVKEEHFKPWVLK